MTIRPRLYFGLFGRRRLRLYGPGIWLPLLGGAIGVGRKGLWVKFSGRRLLRRLFR